ncbi:MAG: SDR family oxidoreductase [Planctomycetes bacterium]|nr:SDR family oxidoreductase [Planctomycetota bacterium]
MHEAKHFLFGKTAIVTGAGRGIGRAIARRFAVHGANVIITSRTADQLDETKRLIERGGGGGRVFAQTADVSNAGDVEKLIEDSHAIFERVDVLVNNAGVAPLAMIEEMEPEMFDHILSTNVRTVYLCTRAVWPIMREQGGGAIVNIASLAAFDPFPGFTAYGAAKAFVVAYTKSLAREGQPFGIRVHGVAPGAVETGMLRGAFPTFPSEKALDADDIAAMVEAVLSPAYRHSTGQTVPVMK